MSIENKTAFPLCWPDNWQRTPAGRIRSSNFQRSCSFAARRHSMDESRRALAGELERMGARDVILSTNIKLRIDGLPYSGQAQPADKGIAVYFQYKKKPTVIACDKWDRVEDNIWSVFKTIEALRGISRWGSSQMMEQAFRGYTALPGVGETGGSKWWEVLGVTINAGLEAVRDAYRKKALETHPDQGGSTEEFLKVQTAWKQFEQLNQS